MWFGSFVALIVYGLGNRRARWWASVNMVTLTLNVYYQYAWTSLSCYTTQDVVLWSIWFAALAAVCLQHVFNLQSSIQN